MPLRVGFLYQFLLIAAWTLAFINAPPGVRSSAANALGVLGGLHLALVAMFTVTESLESAAGACRSTASGWAWRSVLFGPGGGRGAMYVLAQMAVLLLAGWQLAPTGFRLRWFVAICGYICFFTGVPTAVFRWLRPRASAFHVRVAHPGPALPLDGPAGHRLLPAVAADDREPHFRRAPPAQSDPDAGELADGARERLVPGRRSLWGSPAWPLTRCCWRWQRAGPYRRAANRAVRRPRRERRSMSRPSIDWPSVRAAGGLRLALPRTPMRGRAGERLGSGTGSSLEFQDYRPYVPGDDLRHVDWSAYARSGLLAIRLYREEVAPRVDLVLDVSRSMSVTELKLRAYGEMQRCSPVPARRPPPSRASSPRRPSSRSPSLTPKRSSASFFAMRPGRRSKRARCRFAAARCAWS